MALRLIGREEDTEYLDILRFHEKFDFLRSKEPTHLTKRKMKERLECMQEELKELAEAVEVQNLEAIADALIDLVYFAKGTAVQMGLPWKALWDDVQAANMRKERGIGKRGHLVDAIKPPGWIGPKTGSILKAAGYDERRFTDENGEEILEHLCLDDAPKGGKP